MDHRLLLSLLCIFAANATTTPEDIVPEAQEAQRVRGASALLNLISRTDSSWAPEEIVPEAQEIQHVTVPESIKKAKHVIAGPATAAAAEKTNTKPTVFLEGGCANTPNWYDVDGATYNCAWYSQGSNCQHYGNMFAGVKGQTANQACCVCANAKPTAAGSGMGSGSDAGCGSELV